MKMKFRVNVLLVDDEDAPSPVLADFLARLKQAGLNGCLYRQRDVSVGCEKHASRHKDIRLILVDSMKNWGPESLESLVAPVGLFSGVVAA